MGIMELERIDLSIASNNLHFAFLMMILTDHIDHRNRVYLANPSIPKLVRYRIGADSWHSKCYHRWTQEDKNL